MDKIIAENEVFAIRNGEIMTTADKEPTSGRWLAVMLRSVEFPDGPVSKVRPSDGAPVERCAILACQKVKGEWQWCALSAPSKELIGDLFFNANVDRDKWYYLEITQQ